ncbi:MAG: mandelate racemase/muconate lactonizing enzyme family protein [Acidobacteriaceae bacterium]
MIIERIVLDHVVVPARPDSVNSPESDHALHKLPLGGKPGWTLQFDQVPKAIIQLHLSNGVVGLGEAYRGLGDGPLQAVAKELIGKDAAKLNPQALPIPPGRIYDGFECAIVDALARSHGLPLYRMLGGKFRDEVRCAFWTGHRTIADAARKSKQAQELGFDCIKFKCTLKDPVVEWCRSIAEACGSGVSVILDPNERFEHPAQAEKIARKLAEIGNVLCLEDPIPRWNVEAWRYLRRKIHVPLAMHVSLPYAEMGQLPQDATRAVAREANDYFNFNGGIYAFGRLASLADLFELPYWHGSEVDLGILEASYVHKSAAAALAILPADIFGRLVREHDLLRKALQIGGGSVRVPEGPGLGVELDHDALAHYRVRHWTSEP